MKWMRERDLLIAQTMAFVQSVTGKPPEAVKTMTTSAAVVTIETSEVAAEPAPLAEIAALLAQKMPTSLAPAPAPTETPRELSRPTPLPRLDLRDDFQAEIKARVASFRAHQERFNREREAYCSATMAKVHEALKDGNQPTRPAK
ncbi:hypothetical protein [Bradyrhizobium sp. BWA-3-5]|uniref:hypothetical protein n=1 Tax=Bradyrhizobium sp. BWA-3-5 TaxID=3080013 RepID=UPI00293E97BB|nr:hypothetical protein [Bradyrhizobium sp. BWA-3-5]WOH68932.1 hypothetical protein RX331_15055 [Bradyrhizobium sp. BWA-3-5]